MTSTDTPFQRSHGTYELSDDPARFDLKAIHAYLSRSYWSEDIPLDVVERAVRGSLGIGIYSADGSQVGFARCISDYVTFGYLCDVYVLEEHRGQGLSKAMIAMLMNHPKLQGLRRWNLVTRDAHGLYTPFGFTSLARPEGYMEKTVPDIYKRGAQKVR